jgi:asparagine synthase (glutamine-hydrolysing)
MCGLVALLSPAVPIRPGLLDAMRDRLGHRGPDNASSWMHHSGRVALAHRRLSIIDISHAADQPMATDDGRLRIVFNGEIYNYLELRAELQELGIRFRTQSDTEVLLVALCAWGEAALLRLNGMFAFALWDERAGRMLIARDRFGEKPLFVGRGRFGTVAIASEMKAILAHPLVPCSVSSTALERYGTGGWYEDDSNTFFEGIERLPPAHAAWLRADGVEERRWRYWTPDFSIVDNGLRPRDAIDQFSELLQRSLRFRLRADVPIGSSLSGGLDSSTIVGFLAHERSAAAFTQNTFSACFPSDPTISEDREIDSVVRHTGVNSFRTAPEPKRLAAESALVHWHQEEPFLSASIYAQWCVARLAQEHSTTVLLDGQGADELLAGYQFYFRQRQLDLLDNCSLALALRETTKFTRRLVTALTPYDKPQRRVNVNVAYTSEELLAFASSPPPVSHSPYETGTAAARPGSRLRRTLSEALVYNSLPMLLRYADRNSMAFSRETRLPFLDYDLVDFCIRLPDAFLIRNGWKKWILRQAANGKVPESIRWRADKVGYAAPLDNWLRHELREWGRDRALDADFRDVPNYDKKAVTVMWEEHQAGRADHSWALWRWISLAEWLQLYRGGWWRAGSPQQHIKPIPLQVVGEHGQRSAQKKSPHHLATTELAASQLS